MLWLWRELRLGLRFGLGLEFKVVAVERIRIRVIDRLRLRV